MNPILTSETNIRGALSHCSPDVDRDTWVRLLAAVKDALGEAGRDVAKSWSQGGSSFDEADFRDTWKSIKTNGKVTVATLWRMALDAGWKPEGKAHQESDAEREERERKRTARTETEERKRKAKGVQAAAKAAALWKAASPVQEPHPYLELKRVQPVSTLREIPVERAAKFLGYSPKSGGNLLDGRLLVVPVKLGDKLTTAELIDESGRKAAVAGGQKSCGYWAAQPMPETGDGTGLVLMLGEGVVTVLTGREALPHLGVAALSASNLPKVAEQLREDYPAAILLILGEWGAGLKYAEEAARATGAALAVPDFNELETGKKDTDFNDLHRLAGLDAVRVQLEVALRVLPNGRPLTNHIAGVTPPIERSDDIVVTEACREKSVKPDRRSNSAELSSPAKSGGADIGPGPAFSSRSAGHMIRKGNVTPPGPGDRNSGIVKRPSYVVHDDRSAFGPPGVWFHGYRRSIAGESPEPLDVWICSPLHIDAVTCTDDGRCFGRFLRFRDSFWRWRTWAMPMEMLRGSSEELRGELLAAGVHIEHRERGRLPDYLQSIIPERRIVAATRTGWTRDGTTFVLPDEVIGSADVFFQSETMHFDRASERGGDFTTWKNEIAALCIGNPVPALSLCVALSGPLLAKVQRDSGGIHWVADSSSGKTTALNVGCSAWGGDAFRRTWRATANGLEGAAAALNDTCLCLDEINEADPKEIGSIVYALGNGTGKTRANRIGSARHVFRWRLALLSTGERTLTAQMAEGGKQPKAGHLVRLLNVSATRKYGVFDELHGFPDGRTLSNQLKTLCGRHYGHAGPAFIAELLKDGRDFDAALAEVEALPAFQANDSQEGRGAARFALYGMVGELATEWGILPWPTGEAIRAAAEGYRLWREARGGGCTEVRQILQAVMDFISLHGDSRFSEKVGVAEMRRQPPVQKRAGWWADLEVEQGRVYLFNSAGLREATTGHDLGRVLVALESAGWIHERGTNGERAKQTAIGKLKHKLYWILPRDLDE